MDELKRARDALPEPPDCRNCGGSGTVRAMTTDRGPDDYEYDAECVACRGTGSADIRDAIKALPYSLHRVKPGVEVVSRSAVLSIIEARAAADAALAGAPQPVAMIDSGHLEWYIPRPDYALPKHLLTGTHLLYAAAPPAPDAQARDAARWVPMHERAPEPDTECVVILRYTLDRPPFAGVDRWEMHHEDPTGMGGPTIEMGYGWRDNYEADVIAWMPVPDHPPEDWDQRLDAAMQGGAPPAPDAQALTQTGPTRDDLIAALKFYAERGHFAIADDTAWDTVSGEPPNYWCDEAGTATVEDGTIAAWTLAGKLTAADIKSMDDDERAAMQGDAK